MTEPLTYKSSGVDKEAGYESVKRMGAFVKKTFTPGVLSDIGGFGGLFQIDKDAYEEPVLVSGTDGVGTKLMIAFAMDRHDTIGQDVVAMCANDVICQGAKPLFFLDYIATGKLLPEKVADIVKGVAEGCIQAGAALIGGETAEMPGLYQDGEYDVAGFCVGMVDKKKIITGQSLQPGDCLIGLPSSGVHSNGFSLVRKLFFEKLGWSLDRPLPDLDQTLGEALLTPTRIYVKPVLACLDKFQIKGISHITGGGFYENIPRMIPEGLTAKIDLTQYKVPPIFQIIQREGQIDTKEMYGTFNMGIGLVLAVAAQDCDPVIHYLQSLNEAPVLLGHIIEGEGEIQLCHPCE